MLSYLFVGTKATALGEEVARKTCEGVDCCTATGTGQEGSSAVYSAGGGSCYEGKHGTSSTPPLFILKLRASSCLQIRHRQRQLPRLSNYLLTTDSLDAVPLDDTDIDPSRTSALILAQLQPPRAIPIGSAPPPLFYLPAKLLPSQEAFLNRRKREVEDALNREYEAWTDEKRVGLEEVRKLRESAEELSKPAKGDEMEEEQTIVTEGTAPKEESNSGEPEAKDPPKEDEDMNDDGGHEVAY